MPLRPDRRGAGLLRRVAVLALAAALACSDKPRAASGGRAAREAEFERGFQAQAAQLARSEARTQTAEDTTALTGAVERMGPPLPVRFTMTDQDIVGPDSIPSGPVEIHLTNRGQTVTELRFLRVPNEASPAQALQFITERSRLPPGLQVHGGAGPVAPGEEAVVIMMLQSGQYVLASTLPDRGGKPGFLRGLVRVFTATGHTPAKQQVPIIPARISVLTTDLTWRLGVTVATSEKRTLLVEGGERRTAVPPGENLIMLEYYGQPGHDAVIIRADEPRAMRDYTDWLGGRRQAPPTVITGIPALYPTMRAWMKVRLQPGPYIIFCPNYHPSKGGFGFEYGEFNQFVVR